jgi:hypothetical protein
MSPDFYLDLHLCPHTELEPVPESVPMNVAWMSRVSTIVHAHFANSEQEFAIALPQYLAGDFKKLGHVLRVFCESRAALNALAGVISRHAWPNVGTRASGVFETPKSHPFGWVSFHRVRAPQRGKMKPELFFQRVEALKKLPSFPLRSASTGQSFFLAIEKRVHGAESSGAPSGYGLSHGDEVIALPDLPSIKMGGQMK